jgi:hypothetical protein
VYGLKKYMHKTAYAAGRYATNEKNVCLEVHTSHIQDRAKRWGVEKNSYKSEKKYNN